MKIYKLMPKNCFTGKNFKLYRPFEIQLNDEIIDKIDLDMEKLTDDDETEYLRFCNFLSKIVNKEIKKEDLSAIIKDRQIVIED